MDSFKELEQHALYSLILQTLLVFALLHTLMKISLFTLCPFEYTRLIVNISLMLLFYQYFMQLSWPLGRKGRDKIQIIL